MEEVIRKRVVGAAVLVLIGVTLPLLLSRCANDPVPNKQTMRVYELTPSGDIEPVDAQTAGPTRQHGTVDSGHGQEKQETDTIIESAGHSPDSIGVTSQPDESAGDAQPKTDIQQPSDAVKSPPEQQDSGQAQQDNTVAAPSERTTDQRQAPVGSWVVQVASFGRESNARSLAKQLDSAYDAFYTAAQINGETWYRVRIGPFDSDAAANNAAAELRAQGRNTLVVHVD